tara:strand:- start:25 stop:810 length:786 start_codon:yes stop_codon:yes gene_type:complete
MAESALFEEKYRKDMIDAMRQDLAEKGKDRSETRSERSIFNLITRPIEQAQTRVGKFTNDFAKAMLLSAGLEAANIFFPQGEGGGDEDEEGGEDESPIPKVGDYYFRKNSRGGDYYVLQSNGVFKKVGRSRPKTGKQFPKSAFDPVIENIKNNENTNLNGGGEDDTGGGENKDNNTSAFLNFDTEYENKSNFNNIFNSGTPVAMNTGGLEGGEKVTFIDMRNKKETSGQGSDVSGADTELVKNIPDFDPSRSSLYEAFVVG